MKDIKKALLGDMIAGLLIVVLVFVLNAKTDYSFVHKLCDGFTAAGVLLMGVGGLKFVRNQGAFDVMGYGLSTAVHTALPSLRPQNQLGDREEPFDEYRDRKMANRKTSKDLLISGGIFLGLSLIMLVIYLALEQ